MNSSLTPAQAQAFADVIIKSDIYDWGLYDDLAERFPGIDWVSLCEPDAADSRERVPRPAFIGPKLPNEGTRVMDRNIKEHIGACEREFDQPALLFAS
jgi:hypothetical protein